MPVTERRDSGVELLDTDVALAEEAEGTHFKLEELIEIEVGETVANPVYTEAQYFVAASVESELDEETQKLTGEEYVNESSVFVSNEEGELGGGFLTVDEGDVDDAIERFEDEYL